jgi:hypothetical protein
MAYLPRQKNRTMKSARASSNIINPQALGRQGNIPLPAGRIYSGKPGEEDSLHAEGRGKIELSIRNKKL